ncbi:MAG: class I SAM-dependent methyltransferase [Candidatus Bathyarchaeia archaeon]|jgi:hypothetical protein
MGNNLRKVRYLRHPYLIVRTALLPFEKRASRKHSSRLSEYAQYSASLEEGITKITDLAQKDVINFMADVKNSEFLRHIELCDIMPSGMGGVSMDSRLMLYVLTRSLCPKTVVETGVASGVSSAFILNALDRNKKGDLYSVDLHYREGIAVPSEKQLGWVIPKQLRYRWHLTLGESTKVLSTLLASLVKIDIFLHDSRHTYKTMMYEYTTAWKYLNYGGLLLSDDVACNDAFLDFADSVKQKPVVIGRMGALRKIS